MRVACCKFTPAFSKTIFQTIYIAIFAVSTLTAKWWLERNAWVGRNLEQSFARRPDPGNHLVNFGTHVQKTQEMLASQRRNIAVINCSRSSAARVFVSD